MDKKSIDELNALAEEIVARLALVMAESMELSGAAIKEAFLGEDDKESDAERRYIRQLLENLGPPEVGH